MEIKLLLFLVKTKVRALFLYIRLWIYAEFHYKGTLDIRLWI